MRANIAPGAVGTVFGLSHLLGDVYATALIGFIADRIGGDIGLAMLVTMPFTLIASGIIGIRGSRHHAKDVPALGGSADTMLGVHAAGE
jgi:hypothetical protein